MLEKKGKWLIGLPFVALLIVNFFLPTIPIWDERLFFPTVQQIGANYFPTLEQVRTLNSPMGPVYFMIWGFIGKLSNFSLLIMRAIHLLMSFGFVLLLYRLLRDRLTYPYLALLFFVVNPYFLVMTAPLLYTDITALLFIFAGVFYYLEEQNRLLAGLFLGVAICTRQLYITVPMALALNDIFWWFKGKGRWQHLFFHPLPLLCFLPLFFLWDYNV
ncbi:MAG: hypothetical protein AAGJ18_28255, partial [Bacteroidota bacterium]